MEKRYYSFILATRKNGTLYVGVTNDIARRSWEHREGWPQGFTKKYKVRRLVYCESHQTVAAAIQREKNIKHWPRQWKINLIEENNPDWNDIYRHLT